MAYRALLVAGCLAVVYGQEQNHGSDGNYAKFLTPPRGSFSRHTEQNGVRGSGSFEPQPVPFEAGSPRSKQPVQVNPASAKMVIADTGHQELYSPSFDHSSTADSTAPAVFATKTSPHVGATGIFAGALAGVSMLGVRVRRGASSVLRRNAMDDGAVELQGSGNEALDAASGIVSSTEGSKTSGGGIMSRLDIPLLLYFFFWYLGNYYYNITNKTALKAAGGALGFPMTISCLQLGVGSLYSLFLWAAPDARKFPKVTPKDILKLIPVAFCSAGAHAGSVFALSAGAVSFGQIVKAAEPAFAAVIGTLLYGKKISKAKWLCLIPVIGGVCLASLKELDFAVSALVAASIANIFAAFKGNENAEVMATPGLKDRLGSVGNQFAITTILSFLISLPLVFLRGESFSAFFQLAKTNPVVRFNLIASGLWFYGYNELATMTIKKTSAVTASVANTAKRVIVIVGVAIVMGESLNPLKLVGCAIGIGGVLLYSIIDSLVGKKNKAQPAGV